MAPWGQGRDMEGLLTPGPHRPGRPASSQSMAGSEMGKSRVVGADCSNTGVRGHAGMDHLAHPEDRPWTQRDRKTNKGRGRDGIGQAREGQADDQGACEGLQGQVGGPRGRWGDPRAYTRGPGQGRISQVRVSRVEQAEGTPRQVQTLGARGEVGRGALQPQFWSLCA